MSIPNIRYESTHWLTMPFQFGIRHFKVALCNGSQDSLLHLAKERIIYRPSDSDSNKYSTLTIAQRIYHLTVGILETVGYCTLIIAPLVAIADRHLNEPYRNPFFQYSEKEKTHLAEGGTPYKPPKKWRQNPFDPNYTSNKFDNFYQGASWYKKIGQ